MLPKHKRLLRSVSKRKNNASSEFLLHGKPVSSPVPSKPGSAAGHKIYSALVTEKLLK